VKKKDHYISESDFRVWLPEVDFIEKGDDSHNSRQIRGIMSTSSRDRQSERVMAKGLDVRQFLESGHFNDNHSQATSAVVGYPEAAYYKSDIKLANGSEVEGWICEGYVLKGTSRADEIWELAKAIQPIPNKSLGFSIEGKCLRRKDKTIEKAVLRNLAITNCPVNVEATWDIFAKSFVDEDLANKAMSAGFATTPAGQSGGGAIRSESLESDADKRTKKKKSTALKLVLKSMGMPNQDEIEKALEHVFELRPDFTDEAGAELVKYLFKGGRNGW
jgi:hypothetical protein